MGLGRHLASWPVARQLRSSDRLGLSESARSATSATLAPRTEDADKVVPSICPFCAVGCAQRIYVKDDAVQHNGAFFLLLDDPEAARRWSSTAAWPATPSPASPPGKARSAHLSGRCTGAR